MTMPKKGSRTITVDKVPYRFMVRMEGEDKETYRVSIESQTHPGRVCQAVFGRVLLETCGPSQVEQIIRYARREGWNPETMQGGFSVNDTAMREILYPLLPYRLARGSQSL